MADTRKQIEIGLGIRVDKSELDELNRSLRDFDERRRGLGEEGPRGRAAAGQPGGHIPPSPAVTRDPTELPESSQAEGSAGYAPAPGSDDDRRRMTARDILTEYPDVRGARGPVGLMGGPLAGQTISPGAVRTQAKMETVVESTKSAMDAIVSSTQRNLLIGAGVGGVLGGSTGAILGGIGGFVGTGVEMAGGLAGTGMIKGGRLISEATRGTPILGIAGGLIGGGLEMAGEAAVRGSKLAGSLIGPVMGMVGAGMEKGYGVFAEYDKGITQLRTRLDDLGGSVDSIAVKFGYQRREVISLVNAYSDLTGTASGAEEAIGFGRGYGMRPEVAVQMGLMFRLGGGAQGEVEMGGMLRRAAYGAVSPGGIGVARMPEHFRAIAGMAAISQRRIDELGPEGVTNIIGLANVFGTLGEGYQGQRGLDWIGQVGAGIAQPRSELSRAFTLRALRQARPEATLMERMEQMEAGLTGPRGAETLGAVTGLAGQFGAGEYAPLMMQNLYGGRLEKWRKTLGLVGGAGFGEEVRRQGETEAPARAAVVSGAERFALEIETMNIKIGAQSQGLIRAVKNLQLEAIDKLSGGIIGLYETIQKGLPSVGDTLEKFTTKIGQLLGAPGTITTPGGGIENVYLIGKDAETNRKLQAIYMAEGEAGASNMPVEIQLRLSPFGK